MRVLGIDTATAIASVGLATDGEEVVERRRPMGGRQAPTLLPLIDDVLAAAGLRLADLGLLAVSIGPGSFTGLRIGLATVKGLALASGLPVVGVPTLEAYAAALGPRGGTVWPVLDARKGEVYAAAYSWRGAVLLEVRPPSALPPAELARLLEPPCTLLGDGVDAYRDCWPEDDRIARLSLTDCSPSGAMVGMLGTRILATSGAADLAALEPRYCRRSAAEMDRPLSVAIALSTR